MLADKKLNAFILKNTAPQILLIVGGMTRPSNFKGGVVAQGENVASSHSYSNTGALPRSLQLLHNTLQIKIKTRQWDFNTIKEGQQQKFGELLQEKQAAVSQTQCMVMKPLSCWFIL